MEDALQKITQTIKPLNAMVLPLQQAIGYYLADDVLSPIDSPPFTNSAVDGYAFKFIENIDTYKVIGEVKAGDVFENKVAAQQAVRIFTGALVPDNCDTVAMQEHVEAMDGFIKLNAPTLKVGGNVRLQASQLKQHQLVAAKGVKLNAGAIGLLASLGITQVLVFAKPKVGIIVTGDELVEAGQALPLGKIFESNSQMLVAALAEGNFVPQWIKPIKDDFEELNNFIQANISSVDVLLITGGISVGKYDFVGDALVKNGVDQIFYKVKQRPGKPLYFGIKNHTAVFALPGNPASVLTCFYRYVVMALLQMQGVTQQVVPGVFVNTDLVVKSHALTWMVKAYQNNGKVTVLDGQESYKLLAFTKANGLAILNPEITEINANQPISFISFHQFWNPNG